MPEETTPAKPAPKAPAADDDLDDIFSDSDKSTDSPPAKPAAGDTAGPQADDDSMDETADDMPAAGDRNSAGERDSAAPGGDDLDDLFEDGPKNPPKRAAVEPAGGDMEEPTAEDDSLTEEESAQVEPATAEETARAAAPPQAEPAAPVGEMRLWTDNTGTYTVLARLVVVLDGKVRLQKDTGRFTTVPFERLSKPDLAFVQSQVTTIASAVVDRPAEF